MKSKKLIGILLSAALVFSVAMPTVLAAAADSEPDNTVEETSAVSESVEEPASLQEEQEQEASSGELDDPSDSSSDEKKDDLPESTGSISTDPVEDFDNFDDPDGGEDFDNFDDPDDDFDDLDEEPFVHLGDCSDECELDDSLCPCPCHLAKKLVENILACLTLDEVDAVMDRALDEAFQALTEEQNKLIDEHIMSLLPEIEYVTVIISNSDSEMVEPVGEIYYPTVNFDDVAPFGDPVVGGRD